SIHERKRADRLSALLRLTQVIRFSTVIYISMTESPKMVFVGMGMTPMTVIVMMVRMVVTLTVIVGVIGVVGSVIHHSITTASHFVTMILMGRHLTAAATFIHAFRVVFHRCGMWTYMTVPFKMMIDNGCVNGVNMLHYTFRTAVNTLMPGWVNNPP